MVLIKKGTRKAGNRIGDHFIVTTEGEREGFHITHRDRTIKLNRDCISALSRPINHKNAGSKRNKRQERRDERLTTERTDGHGTKPRESSETN